MLSNPPSARWGHTAIYVSTLNSMLIFGGYNGNDLNDLWSYNISSNNWTQLTPSNSPPSPRDGHTAIYVSTLNSMFIFGGYPTNAILLNDLWSYDISSNSWNQLTPSNSPSPRAYHSTIYVSTLNSMFIFGGDNDGVPVNDQFWSYDISSNSWIQLNASNPPSPRFWSSAIYVSTLNSMLIFGGANNSASFNDLWNYTIAPEQTTSLQITEETKNIQPPQVKNSSNSSGTIVGIVLGIFFGLLCIAVLLIIIIIVILKRKRNPLNSLSRIELKQKKEIILLEEKLIIEELIGKGNFGEVYKGKLGQFNVAVRNYKIF
jgi:N-acetylneuraminic acid mutarotase